jgi:phosphoribosylamine--glycine ligase
LVFHAGTGIEEGKILSKGGRVLNVMSRGDNYSRVFNNIYSAIEKIDFPGAKKKKENYPGSFDFAGFPSPDISF